MSSDAAMNSSEDPRSSGTPVGQEGTTLPVAPMSTNPDPTEGPKSPAKGEETLESHEVIELQMFSERKAWIEEKIRLLEKMPPVEVFVGLEAIKASAEQVPGLPTRAELQDWIAEHDIIEKETEIFDKGELKKLRNFTRAATQRNLSPEDTDLIELTLTTIYELDKLLHLLRDRTENLDLLGIRLTWEDHRSNSWADRRRIISDLRNFLETRARFSPSVYEATVAPELPEVHRRGSIASIISVTSTSSESSLNSAGFSRSTRFKLAELLSRDAATLAGRVTSLKHGSVSAAGKVLDKLIDHSRKPVPDELLDEQDKLEEQCINEMENIGKFVMNVVMQWRKADEIYVETMKDQAATQSLLEEIELAAIQHPSGRLSSSFTSRADALVKRLQLRGNPVAPNNSFPRPVHPLFPEQAPFNEMLAQSLSSDILAATSMAKSVDAAAKDYKSKYEAVKRVEMLKDAATEVSDTLSGLIGRLQNGIDGGEGDGSPPLLASTDCLDPTKHSVYLALLPSMLEELGKADNSAGDLSRSLPAALLRLDFNGIDPDFKAGASEVLSKLIVLRGNAQQTRDEVTGRASRLREARKIWSAMDTALKDLELIRREAVDTIDSVRWRQESHSTHGAPPTPESPPSLPLPLGPSEDNQVAHFSSQMVDLVSRVSEGVYNPLAVLSKTLEDPLKDSLSQTADSLKSHYERVKRIIDLLRSVCGQASAMASIRDESNNFHLRIESLIVRYDSLIQNVLEDSETDSAAAEMQNQLACLKDSSLSFIDDIAHRVPLVSPRSQNTSFIKRSYSSLELTANFLSTDQPIELPFELQSLDDAVRADCNAYSMRLNGQVRNLEQAAANYQSALMAKDADTAYSSAVVDMDDAEKRLSALKEGYTSVVTREDKLQSLADLLPGIESSLQLHRPKMQHGLTNLREKCRRMESHSRNNRSSFQDSLLLSRTKALDDLDRRFVAWDTEMKSIRNQVVEAHQTEVLRLEEERKAEELRRRAELDRLAAEETEKARLEQERKVEEERVRLEEEQRQEELRNQILEAEKAERAKLESEEAERARVEEKRLEEERRMQLETERQEAERAKLLDVETRLRETEDQLAEERRLNAERERIAQEERLQKEERHRHSTSTMIEEDVFGLQLATSDSPGTVTQEMRDLLAQVARIRKRLRSIGIKEAVRPSSGTSVLPTRDQAQTTREQLSFLNEEMQTLPSSVEITSVNLQLRSCRMELAASEEMLGRLNQLASLADEVSNCDTVLSDLLEHIDSYPSIPLGPLSSLYTCPTDVSSESQLSGRLDFTRSAIEAMSTSFGAVRDDHRAKSERERILQTWSELEDMANDRINGRRSRPSSVASTSQNSSGRNSRSSIVTSHTSTSNAARKSSGYASLSVVANKGNPRGRLNVPNPNRRAVSGSDEPLERSTSRMSVRSTQRSTSGSSLYGSTFASRQRTNSLTPVAATPPVRLHSRSRTSTASSSSSQKNRSSSPAVSDTSSLPRSHAGRSSSSMSTWSRAPRISFPHVPRMTPKKSPPVRKTYVANPKSKLDVAVGQVVNNLPVGINIEGVAGSWKDQSGKYWIGDKDPKLCFCRILRSQTVMVRVGGGWQELSKFITNHFADSFRLLSEASTAQLPSREEKWISSATLLEAVANSPPRAPRTPEPNGSPSYLPAFALSTPSGTPRSLLSTPSTKGSPLTPLQFMRRAEPEAPFLRPETPSKPPNSRGRTTTVPSTPVRQPLWRP
ncbi:growth arrest-specific 2-like [Moniliophthora roreri MCA 2997]|uniref:Growth arrest-specific 2-like n=1 Tax=Moniliophthora roreri (strain MCA 2997) TaxID=1381753 RepID=V2XX39_MONRO|nr:growth arrest-specific 2-like [Moniliophthora roreri MCA 2997]